MAGEEGSWRTAAFRQSVVSKIDEAIQRSGMPTAKNSVEMENHVFQKAKSKEEYLSFVARLILHVRELNAKKGQGMNGPAGAAGQAMQDPINALQTLARQGTGNAQMIGLGPQAAGMVPQPPNQIPASNLLQTLNQRPGQPLGGLSSLQNKVPDLGLGPGAQIDDSVLSDTDFAASPTIKDEEITDDNYDEHLNIEINESVEPDVQQSQNSAGNVTPSTFMNPEGGAPRAASKKQKTDNYIDPVEAMVQSILKGAANNEIDTSDTDFAAAPTIKAEEVTDDNYGEHLNIAINESVEPNVQQSQNSAVDVTPSTSMNSEGGAIPRAGSKKRKIDNDIDSVEAIVQPIKQTTNNEIDNFVRFIGSELNHFKTVEQLRSVKQKIIKVIYEELDKQ